ncbi:MAG: stage III sporulation protein AD [Firmicutes bacterium]|jgi:stage III sporulation protein AD|nr:stage III sporulation protein AD [Bacillota bacterium]
MEILRVVGFALMGVLLLTLLRGTRSEMAVLLSIALGTALFLVIATRLEGFVSVLSDISAKAGISGVYINTVLRVMGVAYLAGFGAQVCRDAGEGALAAKVEMAGKVLILVMSMPLMFALLDVILRVLPS